MEGWRLRPHLSAQLQLSSAGSTRVYGEFSRFVDDAAQRFQAWTRTLDLRRRSSLQRNTSDRTVFIPGGDSRLTSSGNVSVAAGRT